MTKTKYNELLALSKQSKPDLICLTEILPKNSLLTHTEHMYILDDYKIVCSNLKNRGIIIYCKPTLQVIEIDCLHDFQDYLLCKVRSDTDTLLLCIVYRSPNSSYDNDVKLCNLLAFLPSIKEDQLLIIGDFNYSTICWSTGVANPNSPSTALFLDTLDTHFFEQVVDKPTRVRAGQRMNILDLVLTDNKLCIYDIDYGTPLGCSDHISLVINLNICTTVCSNITRTLYYKGDYESIVNYLSQISWNEIFSDMDTQQCCDMLYDHVYKAVGMFIPTSNQPIHALCDKPWVNVELKVLGKSKKVAWNFYYNNRTSDNERKWKDARNLSTNRNDATRSNYEQKIILNCKNNPKSFWSYVKKRTKKSDDIHALLDDDSHTLSYDEQANTDLLNNYFSSVFVDEVDNNFFDMYKCNETTSLIETIEFDSSDIARVIDKLNISKAPGPDAIHARVIKECKEIFAHILLIVFKKSLEEGLLPSQWKSANVKALFKKGKRTLCSNYRPVSLTSILCKLLESLIRDKVLFYLESNHIITSVQHGFRPGHSCLTQLLELMEDFSNYFDSSDPFDCIYLDFAKAFDRVPHIRLLTKIYNCGIRGNLFLWIKDFLHNRIQRVVIKENKSDWIQVTSGIPQGSVLGPLLFTIFINDLPSEIRSHIKIFADDTKIYNSISNSNVLQDDLDKLLVWSRKWLLPFNVDKCKVIHYGRHNIDTQYFMNNMLLAADDSIKDLGVLFQSNLKFDQHIHTITASANGRIGIIRNTFHKIDCYGFLILYKALIRPILEYCVTIWSPHLRKHEIELETIQRRATKLVPRLCHLSYADRLKALKLDTLYYRRRRCDLLQVFRIINKIDSIPPDNFFEFNTGITRGHCKKLIKPRATTTTKQYSFAHRVINDWNSLPNEVVVAKSLNSFKSLLGKHWSNIDFRYHFTFY